MRFLMDFQNFLNEIPVLQVVRGLRVPNVVRKCVIGKQDTGVTLKLKEREMLLQINLWFAVGFFNDLR